MGAMIRELFKINPWELSDDEFSQLAAEAMFLKKFNQDIMEGAITKVLAKLSGG